MGEPRIEVESRLTCPGCKDAPYVLYRRQVIQANGEVSPDVWGNILWPAPGTRVMPPTNPHDLRCPDCHEPLRRGPA